MLWSILTSNIKTTSKFTIFGYIGTYYAIASALPLTLLNYFLIGWFQDDLDPVYSESWKVFLGLVAVFQLIAPLCFAIYRHRVGNCVFWKAWLEGMKWSIFFGEHYPLASDKLAIANNRCFTVVFFGGISWHLCYALIAHMFCLPIEWASTAKEIEAGGFFISLENVLKNFKWVLVFQVLLLGAMIYLAAFAPTGWVCCLLLLPSRRLAANLPLQTITQFYCIVPLATQVGGHILLPVLSIIT